MFEKLKRRIFKFRYKRKSPVCVTYPHFDKIQNVLILCDEAIFTDSFRRNVATLMQQEGKTAYFWVVSPEKGNADFGNDVTVFRYDDFGFWGNLKKSIQQRVTKHKCDLLVDLRTKQNIFFDYLVLSADAKFCIGREQSLYPYKMRVTSASEQNEFQLLKQMLHYLKMIKSND